jgi:hypothetical protein
VEVLVEEIVVIDVDVDVVDVVVDVVGVIVTAVDVYIVEGTGVVTVSGATFPLAGA